MPSMETNQGWQGFKTEGYKESKNEILIILEISHLTHLKSLKIYQIMLSLLLYDYDILLVDMLDWSN